MDANKKQNLIYIGIALGVLTLTIIFTQLDLGKYFRGFMVTNLEVPVEVTEVIEATTGNPAADSAAAPPTLAPLFSEIPDNDGGTSEETSSEPPTITPLDFEDPEEDEEEDSDSDAKLKDVDAFPKGFNPQLNATKISYSVTGIGKVDIKIHNLKGDIVATLANNQSVEKDDYDIWWDGTDNNKSGKLLEPGTYTYKITLKDSKDDDVLDTASGSLNLIYAKVASETAATPDNGTVKATNLKTTTSNSQAVVSLQNATSGKTAGTGPGTLIYLLFPAAGYIISRRK